ncbi:MAG: hypothetical protein ABI836_15290 [Gemmatimonadota bacterium]
MSSHRGAFPPLLTLAAALAGLVLPACSDQPLAFRSDLVALVAVDTAKFGSLGEALPVVFKVVGEDGRPIRIRLTGLRVADTSIVYTVAGSLSDTAVVLRSRRNGTTTLTLRVGQLRRDIVIAVSQVAVHLEAALKNADSLLILDQGDPIPIVCRAVDRTGHPLAVPPLVSSGAGNTVTAAPCSSVAAERSGFDTLSITSGDLSVRLPVTLVLRPTVSSPVGEFVVIDSAPEGYWAPSMRRNTRGELEVYFASFSKEPDESGYTRGDLHRLISTDGFHFHYDGIALQHDDDICALDGRGIENVAVVPRNDGPGWRMFYAGGTDPCYGWQVFSAVSGDERHWTKEPGVRLSNGGTVPPAAPVYAPWPVGEGLDVERLPSGEWRMLTGGYEHLEPYEDKFQIVEWRSLNQLTWSYVGPVLTTRDLPPEAKASVFSPTIREFAPGLFRMIFSGDNRNSPGGRSRLWSAISTDRTHWRFEGELMGGVGIDLYYAALVDEHLVFIRKDADGITRLAAATVIMN